MKMGVSICGGVGSKFIGVNWTTAVLRSGLKRWIRSCKYKGGESSVQPLVNTTQDMLN